MTETPQQYVALLVADAVAAMPAPVDRTAVDRLLARIDASAVPGRGTEFSAPLRLASGVLADQLLQQYRPTPLREPRARRRGVLVLGAPLSVAATLQANGLPAAPPRRPSRVVVVGRPLEQALAEVWATQVREGRNRTWPGLTEGLAARDKLPPRTQAPAIARRWAERLGTSRVHLATAPGPVPGVRGLTLVHAPVDAAATEAIRATSATLGILTGAAAHARILSERLVPLLAASGGAGPRIRPALEPWLVRRSARLVREAAEAGYPLHGDPAVLGHRGGGSVTWPASAAAQPATLEVVVRALLATCEETP